jgi:hypothetical protein
MTVSMDTIASLGADLLRYESRIKATEETLAKLREMYRRIAEVELPRAMSAAEVTEFRMRDGRHIRVDVDAEAGTPKACWYEAMEWLRASIPRRDVPAH